MGKVLADLARDNLLSRWHTGFAMANTQDSGRLSMALRALLKRNTYYDSITLMSLVQAVKMLPGVEDAGAVMATEMNRQLLHQAGLFPTDFLAALPLSVPLRSEDLLIVIRATSDAEAEAA